MPPAANAGVATAAPEATAIAVAAQAGALDHPGRKHLTRGFSAIFATGSADPKMIGRYKPVAGALDRPGPKHLTRGFSAIFATTSADQKLMGRYKPVTIIGCAELAAPVDREELCARFAERVFSLFPRFRSVARVQCAQAMSFEEIPLAEVDMSYHVQEEDCSVPWTTEVLNKFLSELYAGAKDVERPLWRIHLIPHMASGASMMVRA
ncbi:hypothetical protein T484DRAFT_1815295 [Baffinella frigidus]|nr:hypothetical protein T484DRAFT_1815295 [Cryptophyta sp. CCMP2293]